MTENRNAPSKMTTLPARVVEVPAAHEGRRLDKYLRAQLKGVPASLLFRLLRKGRLRVNGGRVQPNYRLVAGDRLELPAMEIPDTGPPVKLPGALLRQVERGIIHEDAELIVLNKPAEVAVHVGTGVAGGVIEALRHLRPDQPDLELAHRLDRETSGLLMVAKTPAMLRHLQRVLREEETALDRRYLALVRGSWPERLTRVDAPLLRTPHGVTVDRGGQGALTRFSIVRRFGSAATLVEAQLVTGRKHQIRVHAEHAGHPIGGDRRHGDEGFNRRLRELGGTHMFLHAARLGIPLPDGEVLDLDTDVPAGWQRTIDGLAGRPGRSGQSGSGGSPRPHRPRRPRRR